MNKEIINILILFTLLNLLIFIVFNNFYLENYIFLLFITFLIIISCTFSKKFRELILKNWTRLGKFIAKFLNPLIFGIIYFIIITPYSFILKIFKRDFFSYDIDQRKKSYWINREMNYENSLKDQF